MKYFRTKKKYINFVSFLQYIVGFIIIVRWNPKKCFITCCKILNEEVNPGTKLGYKIILKDHFVFTFTRILFL